MIRISKGKKVSSFRKNSRLKEKYENKHAHSNMIKLGFGWHRGWGIETSALHYREGKKHFSDKEDEISWRELFWKNMTRHYITEEMED